ncbi:eukaryotic translation initiation factor SUI1 family protein [Irpex rosettiformis]|uniref:Eukaryotic translation initiation factor SUI1 family protein n=1 Tax=Irpex rosettiformis TaxID=378272 RepID=A0ACB8TRM9_9APHY|nr:eukaryotic translation initiation factor SUI1 family protein [Irpex rosettiformis]
MFKKPCANLKTSAPLRGSDRRKLKQRVISEFNVSNEVGDLLMPEGIQSQKFSTHLNEPGLLYLSSEGDPLWFTLGKGSDALIPTVYTLWKEPNLLPLLTTPAAVVPKLVGGADLMIPGVVQSSAEFSQDQLVAVAQYHRGAVLGYPVAVGHAALSSIALKQADEQDAKGKAVHILHAWKDSLWDMGPSKKLDVPDPRPIVTLEANAHAEADADAIPTVHVAPGVESTDVQLNSEPVETSREEGPSQHAGESQQNQVSTASLPPEEVSSYLRDALLQAISTTIASQSPSLFPISASSFWSNYVLPARPAQISGSNGDVVDTSIVDIKHSTHKSVKTFLKACAKEGLLKLKESKGDVVVTGVFPQNPAVVAHKPYRTLQSVEIKKEKAEQRERQAKEAEEKKKGEIHVVELLKPFGDTIAWFVSAEKDTQDLYTLADVRQILNSYIEAKQLINAHDQQYVNVVEDDALLRAISIKGQDMPDFMKRDDVIKKIQRNMQSWYEIKTEGNEPVRKKGEMVPISVVQKMRQGRKAVTLITGFEPFGLDAEELAEELRKLCSSSTTVSPLQGKSSGLEVMVQGKQMKVIMTYLISKGVPKKWIQGADMLDAKKK